MQCSFMCNSNIFATQGKVIRNEKQWLKYTLIIVTSILQVKCPRVSYIQLVLKQLEKNFTAEVTISFCI